jgi:hypothetical protein
MITAEQIVTAIVEDMLIALLSELNVAPEMAIIYLQQAVDNQRGLMQTASKIHYQFKANPVDSFDIEMLVRIEEASYHRVQDIDDDQIVTGTELALLAVFLLTSQTFGELEKASEANRPRG